MLILGIETSCDETAAAIIDLKSTDSWEIRSEIVASQVDLHVPYGGVVPELAARAHLQQLPLVVDRALTDAGLGMCDLDGVGVTRGPGLKGCLLTGLSFAQGLVSARQLPFIGVNHIEGHMLAALLDNPSLEFPHLSLVVSGGHTEIHHVARVGGYTMLARTIDDAAGEAFDKSAHLLGFSYPGGAALAKLADSTEGSEFQLPRVMRGQEGFSFSGLKTAIALLLKRQDPVRARGGAEWRVVRAQLAYTIQEAIVDALTSKVKAALHATKLRRLAVTGGVAANARLRSELAKLDCEVCFPSLEHCMDNGAMIAFSSALRLARRERSPLSDTVLSRWPVETLI